MANQAVAKKPDEDPDKESAGEDGAEAEVEVRPRRGPSGKKLVLFVALPVLLLLAAGAGAYFTGLADSILGLGGDPGAEAAVDTRPGHFYELPEMLVNLTSSGKRASFLKLRVSLELTEPDSVPQVEAVLPRIIDSFQTYLRELRVEDLRGSAGLYRLREELLLRINAAVKPVEVRDVLFKEMLVQ